MAWGCPSPFIWTAGFSMGYFATNRCIFLGEGDRMTKKVKTTKTTKPVKSVDLKRQIEMLPPESLKEYEKNPRINDQAVDAVCKSIKAYGFNVPCLIDKDGTLITGHTRKKAAIKLGLKQVPCLRIENLSPAQVRGFRIADNKSSELATWDLEL
jgi:hypothetical protein